MTGPFKMKNSALKMSAKSGSPMQANYGSPLHKGKTSLTGKIKALGKGISAAWRASATENVGTSIMHGKQAYIKSKKESRDAETK